MIGWQATAKHHPLTLLPIQHGEYLGIDVMAFADTNQRWPFPTAVIELENSTNDDRIAYALWKVLCIRADLRIVMCYRHEAQEAPALMAVLRTDVTDAMDGVMRRGVGGHTLIVVGSRGNADTFPNDFFRWWWFELETGVFRRWSA
jgi:hypothetical protein